MKNKWRTEIRILIEHTHKSNKKSCEFIINNSLKHLVDITDMKIKTKKIPKKQ